MIKEFRDFQFLQGFSFDAGFHLMMQFSSCVVQGLARDGTVLRFFVLVPNVPWLRVPVPVPFPGIYGTGIPTNPGTTAHPLVAQRHSKPV